MIDRLKPAFVVFEHIEQEAHENNTREEIIAAEFQPQLTQNENGNRFTSRDRFVFPSVYRPDLNKSAVYTRSC